MTKLLKRAVDVRDEEISALAWSFLYHFCLMAGYYILQPLRDEMGIAAGSEDLPGLFVASMLLMLAVNPVFSVLVSRMSRTRFIPLVYRFFLINLAIFYGLLKGGGTSQVRVAQSFFLWVSLFNLFAVSVFWAFLADLFSSEQGKRLFGFVGAGGTLGQMAGSLITAGLARAAGPVNLLLLTMVLLEAAVQSARRLARLFRQEEPGAGADSRRRPSGGALEGIALIFKSRYLLGICLYMFLYTFTSSFLYFGKIGVVGASLKDPAARTAFLAKMNLAVSLGTVAVQLFVTGRLIARLGVSLALGLVPLVTVGGFLTLASWPVLAVYATFDVLRKTLNYAIARPAREVLYTVVSRQEKYKSKSFIDTFIYRGGDALAAGSFALFTRGFSLGAAGIALAAVPFALAWLVNALAIGNRQQELAAAAAASGPGQ